MFGVGSMQCHKRSCLAGAGPGAGPRPTAAHRAYGSPGAALQRNTGTSGAGPTLSRLHVVGHSARAGRAASLKMIAAADTGAR